LKYGLTGLRADYSAGTWQLTTILIAIFGGLLYVGGAAFWMVILSRNELSIVYPIAVGVTVPATTAAAIVLFGESVTLWRLARCAFVILGVGLISRG
jgi:multidrug transporter EmrE-like cation transporter